MALSILANVQFLNRRVSVSDLRSAALSGASENTVAQNTNVWRSINIERTSTNHNGWIRSIRRSPNFKFDPLSAKILKTETVVSLGFLLNAARMISASRYVHRVNIPPKCSGDEITHCAAAVVCLFCYLLRFFSFEYSGECRQSGMVLE